MDSKTTFANLKDLFDALKAKQIELTDDLPTFGGFTPASTREVWSWDATHLIVGTCRDDLELVAREDTAAQA